MTITAKRSKTAETSLHSSLQAALSRSMAETGREDVSTPTTKKPRARRRTIATNATTTTTPHKVSRRWKYVAPQLRDYLMYAGIIALSSRRDGAVVRLPHIGQEQFHLALEANNSTLFARSTGVTGLNSKDSQYSNGGAHGWLSRQQRQKPSTMAAVFNERFLRAMHELFGVNPRVTWSSLRKNILAQLNGIGVARQWTRRYQSDSNLGLFNSHVPIIMRVTYGRENEEESQYLRFVRDTHAPAVKLDLEQVLGSRLRLEASDRTDRLSRTVLREIGSRSLYYRRIYMAHLLIWIIACECEHQTNEFSQSLSVGTSIPANDLTVFFVTGLRDHDHRLVIFLQPRLRPLIQLSTSASVLLHTDRRITLDYL